MVRATETKGDTKRAGRPPMLDDQGTATRERLLDAAVASCVEHGFDGATVGDIARRAGVSAPGIYNHFDGKVDLLVEAGRSALDRLSIGDRTSNPSDITPTQVAHAFMAPDFAESRRFLTELHAAAQRHPDVADLLAKWHGDQAAQWVKRARGRDRQATVKAFFALLLGLAQIDALVSIDASPKAMHTRVDAVVDVLFPGEGA